MVCYLTETYLARCYPLHSLLENGAGPWGVEMLPTAAACRRESGRIWWCWIGILSNPIQMPCPRSEWNEPTWEASSSTSDDGPELESLRRAVAARRHYLLGITAKLFDLRSRSSAVTRVRSKTTAVAARKRSAGS